VSAPTAPDLAPVPKVIAGTVAGASTVVLVWLASLFGLDVPNLVAGALTVLLSATAGYMKRP